MALSCRASAYRADTAPRSCGHRSQRRASGRALLARVGLSGALLYLDARNERGLPDREPIALARATAGAGALSTQATNTKRPVYRETGLRGGPCYVADGVDDAWDATGLDLSALDAVTVAACFRSDLAGAYQVILEYGVPYYNRNGLAFGLDDQSSYWVGNGNAGGAQYWLGSETLVGCARGVAASLDRGAASADEIRVNVGGDEGVPATKGDPNNTAGNYLGAGQGWLLSRNNGAAAPFKGALGSFVVLAGARGRQDRALLALGLIGVQRGPR